MLHGPRERLATGFWQGTGWRSILETMDYVMVSSRRLGATGVRSSYAMETG